MAIKMNKTTKYLFVPFAYESSSFIDNYNECHAGIDLYLDDDGYKNDYKNCVFVHLTKNKINDCDARIKAFSFEDNYMCDYPVEESEGKEHMIVFKVRDKFIKTFNHFLNGNYFRMYNTETINKYFFQHNTFFMKYKGISITASNIKILTKDVESLEQAFKHFYLSPYHVLIGSHELRKLLAEILNVDHTLVKELESVPYMHEEVFRYASQKEIDFKEKII